MGLRSRIDALLMALVLSDNLRYVVFPNLAAGITLTGGKAYAYGAWAEIAAAAAITADTWLTGGELAEGLPAGEQYQVQLGSGGAGVEAGLAATTWDTRNGSGGHFRFPYPLRIASGTRIAARAANAAAGAANTIIAKGHFAQTLGQ